MPISVCYLWVKGSLSTGKDCCTWAHVTAFPAVAQNYSDNLRRTFSVIILFIFFTQPNLPSLPPASWCTSPTSIVWLPLRDPTLLRSLFYSQKSCSKPKHYDPATWPHPLDHLTQLLLLPVSCISSAKGQALSSLDSALSRKVYRCSCNLKSSSEDDVQEWHEASSLPTKAHWANTTVLAISHTIPNCRVHHEFII